MEEYVDVIKDGQIQKVTEQEAREEGLFILRRPTVVSAKPAQPTTSSKSLQLRPTPTLRTSRPAIDYSKNNVRSDLIEHFNWEIGRARKLKNLTRKQLANMTGVQEEDIKMLETGELPSDNFAIINKIEHYLGISLRRNPAAEPKYSSSASQTNSTSLRAPSKAPEKEVTLASLQKKREIARGEVHTDAKKPSMSGNDIEIIE